MLAVFTITVVMGMRRVTTVIVAASVAFGPCLKAEAAGGQLPVVAPSSTQAVSSDCVRFQSPTRLPSGTPFRAALVGGLEFRLSRDWEISVGPLTEPDRDYLWVVSPPLRTASHRVIGPGYGVTARESARIERPFGLS